MPASTPLKGNPFGGIIDLSDGGVIAKAPRGATKEFEPELVELMSTMTATHAIAVTGFVVKRGDYPANDAGETTYKNERQRVGARGVIERVVVGERGAERERWPGGAWRRCGGVCGERFGVSVEC